MVKYTTNQLDRAHRTSKCIDIIDTQIGNLTGRMEIDITMSYRIGANVYEIDIPSGDLVQTLIALQNKHLKVLNDMGFEYRRGEI